jgi:hypothetical protein
MEVVMYYTYNRDLYRDSNNQEIDEDRSNPSMNSGPYMNPEPSINPNPSHPNNNNNNNINNEGYNKMPSMAPHSHNPYCPMMNPQPLDPPMIHNNYNDEYNAGYNDGYNDAYDDSYDNDPAPDPQYYPQHRRPQRRHRKRRRPYMPMPYRPFGIY